jgi:hypothetical protein
MQIVDKSFFTNLNYLHIPLSVNDPSGSVTPSNATELDSLCITLEREILLNALGLSLYKDIKALTAETIELEENARFKKLIRGDEYNGKIWLGLDHEDSLIANYIYQEFVTQTDIRLSATGAKKVNSENATNQTPKYLIAGASQKFIKQYQSEYLIFPNITDNFTDWFGCDSIEKSLYGYLMDNRESFLTWKPEYFKVYETKNSFGI